MYCKTLDPDPQEIHNYESEMTMIEGTFIGRCCQSNYWCQGMQILICTYHHLYWVGWILIAYGTRNPQKTRIANFFIWIFDLATFARRAHFFSQGQLVFQDWPRNPPVNLYRQPTSDLSQNCWRLLHPLSTLSSSKEDTGSTVNAPPGDWNLLEESRSLSYQASLATNYKLVVLWIQIENLLIMLCCGYTWIQI